MIRARTRKKIETYFEQLVLLAKIFIVVKRVGVEKLIDVVEVVLPKVENRRALLSLHQT